MKSIGQAQAEALADGFLGGKGTAKGEFKPAKVLSEVLLIAGAVVKEAQENLNRTNSNAAGGLSQSLEISEPIQEGSIFKCEVSMVYYGQFVNKGVKGLKSGTSNAGFSFKNYNVSRGFIKSLEQGRKSAGVKISNTNTNKTISKNEKKNATISEAASAWGAAINIKKFGIKPTGFMDKAIDTIGSKVQKQLGIALNIDIVNSLKNDN
jgi:hypothetical protein